MPDDPDKKLEAAKKAKTDGNADTAIVEAALSIGASIEKGWDASGKFSDVEDRVKAALKIVIDLATDLNGDKAKVPGAKLLADHTQPAADADLAAKTAKAAGNAEAASEKYMRAATETLMSAVGDTLAKGGGDPEKLAKALRAAATLYREGAAQEMAKAGKLKDPDKQNHEKQEAAIAYKVAQILEEKASEWLTGKAQDAAKAAALEDKEKCHNAGAK